MEPIDRDALLAAYDAAHKGPPGGARKLIEQAPTIDAVPVVRCTACKHWDQCSGLTARMCYQWRRYTKQFDYCSYGEARACG